MATAGIMKDYFNSRDTGVEWQCLKLSISLIAGVIFECTLFHLHEQPFPEGICNWVNCAAVVQLTWLKWTVAVSYLALLLFYIREVGMRLVLPLLFAMGVVIFSLNASNGFRGENGIFSLMFLLQWVAYVRHKRDEKFLQHYRIQYVLQIMAAIYVLSAIAKWSASGWAWANEAAPNFVLQIMRTFYCDYVSTANDFYLKRSNQIISFLLEHQGWLRLLLWGGWLAEWGAFTLLINKKAAWFYGWYLLAFHIGIYFCLGIFYASIIFPMIIFCINPVYFLWKIVKRRQNTILYKINDAG